MVCRRQARGFSKGEEQIELAALDALDLFGRPAVIDHAAALHHIAEPVAHPGFGGLAVAAGAAGLLIIGLDGGRHVEMGDIAHVGLVDAHAEGDGGNEAEPVLLEERVLVFGAPGAVHLPAW